ncbi:Uncharacterized protein OBRU01_04566 [Operophtera brumata]|uniref:Endonuclease-reverse transcriptase n=1 Tax=Operophtera brumata TaxID=104452 RepID=A0A0L7LMH1_OPEBR|nr:Uncharacterized protein OBRU01_04566 [Operophtera brumata]
MTTQAVDQSEIRNRSKILLIHGVAEENKEVTATAVSRVVISQLKHAEFSIKDISRWHRMGRSSNDRPRLILVKFRDVSLRDKLWFSKTHLKDSGITISKFLTKARHEVFMQARQRFGVAKCWTREGYVFVVGPDDIRHRVSCLADLDRISGQRATDQSLLTSSRRRYRRWWQYPRNTQRPKQEVQKSSIP